MLHHRKFERRAQAVRYDGDAVDRFTKGEYVVGSGLGRQLVEFGVWFGLSHVGEQASGVDERCI